MTKASQSDEIGFRSCPHTFARLAFSPYPAPRIVRTYKLNARKPLFTSYSIVIYRDNYPDHRAIEAWSFTIFHEMPMGSAPVLEGSMRRHTTMAIALAAIRYGRFGKGL